MSTETPTPQQGQTPAQPTQHQQGSGDKPSPQQGQTPVIRDWASI